MTGEDTVQQIGPAACRDPGVWVHPRQLERTQGVMATCMQVARHLPEVPWLRQEELARQGRG